MTPSHRTRWRVPRPILWYFLLALGLWGAERIRSPRPATPRPEVIAQVLAESTWQAYERQPDGGPVRFGRYRHASGRVLDGGPVVVRESPAAGTQTRSVAGPDGQVRVRGTVRVDGVPAQFDLTFPRPPRPGRPRQVRGELQYAHQRTQIRP